MDGFLNLIIEVWNQDFLGISIGNVVISLIIIVTSLILRALIISRVFKFLENLAKETETEADDILLETLEIIKALKIKELTMIIKEMTTLPIEIPRKS